jgi:hypothetical protein
MQPVLHARLHFHGHKCNKCKPHPIFYAPLYVLYRTTAPRSLRLKKSEGGNKLPDNGEGTHKAIIMQTIEMEESQGKIKSHLPCFAIYASVDGKWFLTARNSADGDGHISLFSEMHLMLHCIDFGGPCQLLKYQFQLPPFLHKEHVRIHRRHSSWLLRALTMQCMSLMSMGDA